MNHTKPKIGLKNNFDKLLFLLATVYLMSVMAWIWKQHQTQQITSSLPPINNNQQSQSNNIVPLNQENIPLPTLPNNQINLVSVDNKNPNSPSLTPPPPLPSLSQPTSFNNTLTIPPLPNTQISANPSEVSPLPIPQPPQPMLPPPPPLPSINNIVNSSPSSSPSSPISPPPPPKKLTKVPVISSANNSISPANNQNNNTVSIASLPSEAPKETNYNYTLLGVVELGNSDSLAMFNINNITEKVSIGSEIGTTGWVLMGINDKQAIISRNNQSIYVRVGETF
ncbi:hypothetical protein [Geminocystis herdmanii]|uniref:hypothetical protein n=1 Tax=Geminocystis herdmanii TaxID=669359 RepID=UPI0003483E5E|nr:hypothetical protein [Geminocystis herdmanii]